MCTLSWLPHPDGYSFWHGRDERTTRLPAEPPSVVRRGGLRALAPRDGDAGGTWVGVNERGLTLGLANLYPPEGIVAAGGMLPKGKVTRGRIVDELLAAPDAKEAARRLDDMDLPLFAPFTLAVLEPGSAPRLHRWDGTELGRRTVETPGLLLTSSGGGRRVEEIRQAEYERLAPGPRPDAEAIDRLHRTHIPGLPADSFCMHREEAETVSLTRVEVRADGIRMIYTPGAPCRTGPLQPAVLTDSLSPFTNRSSSRRDV